MPISFGCSCGKKLQAKDEFAGRKMKCPGCGAVLTIPEEPAVPPTMPPAIVPAAVTQRAAAPPPPPIAETAGSEDGGFSATSPPPPAPDPNVVRFVCHCGRRLKGLRQDVGEEIECPDCRRSLVIPAEDTDEPPPAAPPRPRNVAAPVPIADPLFEQTLTPWPDAETRRRGADGPEPRDEKVGSWLGTSVLVLLLAAAAALWYFAPQFEAAARDLDAQAANARPRPPRPLTDLERVPGNALAFAALRLPDPAAAQTDPAAHKQALKLFARMAGKVRAVTDIDAAKIERLTVVVFRAEARPELPAPGARENEVWALVRTRSPSRPSEVLRARAADVKKRTYHGKTYYIISPRPSMPPGMMGGGMPRKGMPGKGMPGKGMGKGMAGGGMPKGGMPGGGMPKGGIPEGGLPRGAAAARATPAVCFLAPNLFVVGTQASVRRFLRTDPTRVKDPPLAGALAAAGKVHALTVGVNQTDDYLRPRAASARSPLTEFDSALLTFDVAAEVPVELHLTFENATLAAAARAKAAEDGLEEVPEEAPTRLHLKAAADRSANLNPQVLEPYFDMVLRGSPEQRRTKAPSMKGPPGKQLR